MRGTQQTDRVLAIGFVLGGLGAILLPASLGRLDLTILTLYISLPLIGSTVLYSTPLRRTTELLTVDTDGFRTTVGIFLLLQGASLFLLGYTAVRPFAYYLIVALLATVIFVQIVASERTAGRSLVILGEISVLLLNLVWGVTFKYHFYIGRTDTIPHAWYVDRILATNAVTDALGVYQAHPLWNILAAVEIGVFGVPIQPRYVLFFTSGLAYVFAVVGIYAIARRVLDSERIALCAALLTATYPFVLDYARYAVPRSIASVFLVLLLLAVLGRGYRNFALLALVTVGIVVYHTVSTPFILVGLGVLYLLQFGFLDRPLVRLHELALVAVVQLVYWFTVATTTLNRITSTLANPGIAGGGPEVTFDPIPEVMNYLSFSLLILLVAYGSLVEFSDSRRRPIGRVLILTGVLLSVVTFPGPFQLLDFAEAYNFTRFGQYTYPFIVIAAATGLVAVAETRPIGRLGSRRVFIGLAILLVFTTSFFAVSNDFTASDNPLVQRDSFYTFYLSGPEETGFTTLANVSDGYVYGDQVTCKYLENSPYPEKCHITEADLSTHEFLAESEDGVYLVRTTELDRRPVTVYNTSSFDLRPSYTGDLQTVGAENPLWADLETHDRVYASEDVVGYTSVNATEATADGDE